MNTYIVILLTYIKYICVMNHAEKKSSIKLLISSVNLNFFFHNFKAKNAIT